MLLFKSDGGVLCSNSLQHKYLWITINQRQRPHDSQPDAQELVRCRSGFCHTTGSIGMNGTIYHGLPTLPHLLRKLGISGVAHALDQMMVLDYLIANEDRHFNNFGLLRNPDTLEWLGPAPIYDSGSSLGYDKLTPQVRSGRNITCKPFKKTHQDQLRLATSFNWLDLSKLSSVDQDIREVFAGAEEFIDKERVEAIIASVNQRIQMLETFILTQQPQMDSTEYDVEKNVAAEYGMKL